MCLAPPSGRGFGFQRRFQAQQTDRACPECPGAGTQWRLGLRQACGLCRPDGRTRKSSITLGRDQSMMQKSWPREFRSSHNRRWTPGPTSESTQQAPR